VSRFAGTRIEARGPFDHHAALATLAAHAVEGLHRIDLDAGTLSRWVEVAGEPHAITVGLDAGGAALRTASRDRGVNTALAARVRHWFDLDTDLAPVNGHLGADPLLSAHVAARPGVRITRFHAAFEAVVLTVLGQQVSLAAGRLFGARLVAAYGEAMPADRWAGGLRRFPTAAALAARPVEELRAAVGLTGSRARTVHEVAVLFAAAGGRDALPPRAALHALHGIGPWTLDYLAIRAGTDPDAFPATDAVLRRALSPLAPADRAARIGAWSPYRSYAASRLWSSTA
jgi:3-methyladenine DNA glycosylase/8-oxoguanine DNA glycosylase